MEEILLLRNETKDCTREDINHPTLFIAILRRRKMEVFSEESLVVLCEVMSSEIRALPQSGR